MLIFINAIGILITAMGIMILLNPKAGKKMMAFWRQGKNIYIGGLIRVLLGGIFLYYAPQARLPMAIFALGVLAILGGLFIFILGLEKTKAILDCWDKKPERSLRLLSLLVIVFGALIFYSA